MDFVASSPTVSPDADVTAEWIIDNVTFADVSLSPMTTLPDGAQGTIVRTSGGAPRGLHYYHVVYLSLALVIGVPGNALVVAAYAALKNKSSCDWYILHIAVLDLIICLFRVPSHLAVETGHWRGNGSDGLCKFVYWLSQSVITTSVIIFGFIGVDRYIKVCRPSMRISARFSRNSVLLITLVSALFALPTFWMYGNNAGGSCVVLPTVLGLVLLRYYYTFLFSAFIAMFLIVVVCYTSIIFKVKKSHQVMRRHMTEDRLSRHTQGGRKIDDRLTRQGKVRKKSTKTIRGNQVAALDCNLQDEMFKAASKPFAGRKQSLGQHFEDQRIKEDALQEAQTLDVPTIEGTDTQIVLRPLESALSDTERLVTHTSMCIPHTFMCISHTSIDADQTSLGTAQTFLGTSQAEIVNRNNTSAQVSCNACDMIEEGVKLEPETFDAHTITGTNTQAVELEAVEDRPELVLSPERLKTVSETCESRILASESDRSQANRNVQSTTNNASQNCIQSTFLAQRYDPSRHLARNTFSASSFDKQNKTFHNKNSITTDCQARRNCLITKRSEDRDEGWNAIYHTQTAPGGCQTGASIRSPLPSSSPSLFLDTTQSRDTHATATGDEEQTDFTGTGIHNPTSCRGKSFSLTTSRSFRLTLLLLLVTAVFVISWIPPYVAMVWYFYIGYDPPLSSADIALQKYAPTGYVLNHFANPIIFLALSSSFRHNVAALWKSIVRKLK